MSRLSRRHFVASGLAGATMSALPTFATTANAATVTRYNVASVNGQAMLKRYAAAVKIMMATPPGNPLSWTFQWYTHAVPSNTTKQAQINSIYGPNPSPNKSLATLMWNTCQAHFNAADEPYFLPWHRMYVCFFENIIRKVLGDNTFSLPYWNYSVPAAYSLPDKFRMPNDPTFGSLYRQTRRAAVNAGQPIFSGVGMVSDLSPASALGQPNYLQVGVSNGFCAELDQNLHGNVHVFVGNGQGMGSIPWAANDPIFWLHHCNIDRLWVSWNSANHANPNTNAWLSKKFVFADQSGQEVKAIVKDYSTTEKCGYKYDQLTPAPTFVATLAAPILAAQPPLMLAASSTGETKLGDTPMKVSMKAAAPSPAGPLLAARVQNLSVNRRLYLVIKNLKASAEPETLFRVYLDLPDGAPDDPLNSHYVGSFHFFDAVALGDDHGGHGSKPFTFDITTVAANLQARGLLKPEHTVTIVPSRKPAADAQPVVGEISLVEQ